MHPSLARMNDLLYLRSLSFNVHKRIEPFVTYSESYKRVQTCTNVYKLYYTTLAKSRFNDEIFAKNPVHCSNLDHWLLDTAN